MSEIGCKISKAGFHSEADGKKIVPAIIICTFKREEYVYENLKRFRDFGLSVQVILVDNGKTIEKNKIDYEYCRVVQNKNYGGSGGFTRGMLEALNDERFTHIILLDDDAKIECGAIKKTISFLSFIKDDKNALGIAGGMLEARFPYRQFEASAKWENGRLIHLNHNLDLRDIKSLIENEKDKGANYGAWWYLCMPVFVLKKGLPFPFFIKTDDIEFGLRTLNRVIAINGIGLWHDSFEEKFNYYLEYYIKRNELVCSAVHEKHTLGLALKKLFFALGKCLTSYNYASVKYILRAYDDYLKGPDFFLKADEEKLNSELRKEAEELIKTDITPFQNVGASVKNKRLLRILTLNGYLIPSCFLKKEIKAVAWSKALPKDCFGYKRIIEYDFFAKRGVYRTIKKRWLFKAGAQMIKYTAKLIIKNKRITREYKTKMSEITSAEFWRRHLDIE